jgi:ferritin-like protein
MAHPAVQSLLRFFEYDHLSYEKAREVSKQFHDLAHTMAEALPDSAETTVAIRKILEAKDCAVRAVVYTIIDEGDE